MDIARDICTDSFYIVNSGLPCIPVTAVEINQVIEAMPGSVVPLAMFSQKDLLCEMRPFA